MYSRRNHNTSKLPDAFAAATALLVSVSLLPIGAVQAQTDTPRQIQESDLVNIHFSQESNGRGSEAWVVEDPSTVQLGVITGIEICHGRLIDSITVSYNNVRGKKLGGGGGRCDTFQLQAGEFIREIHIWNARLTDAIQFVTNKQRSDVYGNPAGGEREIIQDRDGGVLRQVDGKFGRYLTQARFGFGLPYTLSNFNILIPADFRPESGQPDRIDSFTGNRCPNLIAGTAQFADQFEKSVTDSHTFSFGSSTTIGLETTVSVGLPSIAEAGITISAQQQFDFGTEDSTETTNTRTQSYNFEVPPGKSVEAVFTAKSDTIAVPFTYSLNFYRNNNPSDIVRSAQFSGLYEGVLFSAADTTLYDVDCATGERRQLPEGARGPLPEPAPAPAQAPEPAPAPAPAPAPVPAPAPAPQPSGGPDRAPQPSQTATPAHQGIEYVATSNDGAFLLIEEGVWHEVDGDRTFIYDVFAEDEDCIYLLDRNRGVVIVLDFRRGVVEYAPNAETDTFDLYQIVGTE